jgi:hemerythrin
LAIQWTPDLAVGIEEIDAQHQQLFAATDALLEAMRQGKGQSEVAALLRFLQRYVVEHFGLEEKAMAEARYPGLEAHRAQHQAFTAELAVLFQKHAAAGPSAATVIQVNDRVCGWLRSHIAGSDKALGAFLAARRRAR